MALACKWGLPPTIWKPLFAKRNTDRPPPIPMDRPDECLLGQDHWYNYPVQDYNYRYNSWGMRGDDYEQYQGQAVNICIGDSMAVNIGGPVEHSWPYQLSRHFNIPTLNFGIDGLSFYNFDVLLNKIRDFFDVRNIFVLYNLFDIDAEPVNLPIPVYNNVNIVDRIEILKKYCWVHGAHWQFDPDWTFDVDELRCLYEHFPTAHDYLKKWRSSRQVADPVLILKNHNMQKEYMDFFGIIDLSYEKFCQIYLAGDDVGGFVDPKKSQIFIQEKFRPFVRKVLDTNRDGWHMSQGLNRVLAEYFVSQVNHW